MHKMHCHSSSTDSTSALTDEQSLSGKQQLIERSIDELANLGLAKMAGVRRHLVLERLAEIIGLPTKSIDQMLAQGISKIRPSNKSAIDVNTPKSLLTEPTANSIDKTPALEPAASLNASSLPTCSSKQSLDWT